MGTQMTERFSAPGATLVKLFGRPAEETREFVARAARVRDIGVRTAMVQWVFVTALTLVSALALALVYGLGGYFALSGGMAAGRRGGAGAAAHPALRPADRAGQRPGRRDERAGQLRAGVRGARPAAADRRAEPTRGRCRTGPLSVEFDGGRLRLPGGRQGVAGLAGGGRPARHPGRRAGPARCVVPGRAGAAGRAGRVVGRGQVDDRPAAPPALRRRLRRGPARRGRRARPVLRHDPRGAGHGHPGRPPVPRVDPGQPAAGPARGRPRRSSGTRCAGPGWPTSSRPCPTGWTRSSASGATGSPAASGSG